MDISHFLVLVFIGFLFVKKNFRVKLFDMIKKNKIFLVAGSLLLIYIVANEPFVVEGMTGGEHCHPPIIPCGTEKEIDKYEKWGSDNIMDAEEAAEARPAEAQENIMEEEEESLEMAEVEAQAAAMFAATPPEERRLAAPPTLEGNNRNAIISGNVRIPTLKPIAPGENVTSTASGQLKP